MSANLRAYGAPRAVTCPRNPSALRPSASRQVNELVLRGVIDYVQGPDFRAWIEEATAAPERARRKKPADDEAARLEAAVRAQAAKVDRAAERFVEHGTEAVKAVLAREEEKLRRLRRELAGLSMTPAPRPVDLKQAARAFEDIGALVEADVQAAHTRLARYLEPVVLTPVKDEETGELVYNFDVAFRNDAASLVTGGRGRVYGGSGCGGAFETVCTTEIHIPKTDHYASRKRGAA